MVKWKVTEERNVWNQLFEPTLVTILVKFDVVEHLFLYFGEETHKLNELQVFHTADRAVSLRFYLGGSGTFFQDRNFTEKHSWEEVPNEYFLQGSVDYMNFDITSRYQEPITASIVLLDEDLLGLVILEADLLNESLVELLVVLQDRVKSQRNCKNVPTHFVFEHGRDSFKEVQKLLLLVLTLINVI